MSAAVRTPELYYEAFLLGLLVRLRPDYHVASQQDAGRGRADILITPRRAGLPGAVLELKSLADGSTPTAELAAALAQIDERAYVARLREHGASPIHQYAAVFDRQRVWIQRR